MVIYCSGAPQISKNPLEKEKTSPILFILQYESKWALADLTVSKEILFIMYLQLLD